jgi:hypothetical protein
VHFSFGFLVYILRKRSSDFRLDPPCKIGWLSFSQFPSGSSAVVPRIQLLGVLFRLGHPCRGFTGSSPCGRTKGRSSPRVNRGDNLWGPSCGSFTLPFIKNFELFPTREWACEPRAVAPVNKGENMWRLLCGSPIPIIKDFERQTLTGGAHLWKSYDVISGAVLFQNCFSCFLKWDRQPRAATTFSTVSRAWWIHDENN